MSDNTLISSDKKALAAQIVVPLPLGNVYTYLVPESLEISCGDIVRVEFGRQVLEGVVWDIDSTLSHPSQKLKYIQKVCAPFSLNADNLKFLKWMAIYTMAPKGAILKMMMSVPEVFQPYISRRRSISLRPQLDFNQPLFEFEQQKALTDFENLTPLGYSVTLLDGITGSGKTEVYLEMIKNCFEKDQQALILLPQIFLAPQIADRFYKRFGVMPLLWHSGLTKAQRRDSWTKIQTGEAKAVIGARSALLLPYAKLGMIVVDEEHDHAYKQEDGVIYQARDMAVARAYLQHIPCVLVSATPSLETLYNCDLRRYNRLYLKTRYGPAQLPAIHVIDMRSFPSETKKNSWISPTLIEKMTQAIEAEEQVLIYLNRRGYAPITVCGECGIKLSCPYCTAWLVNHRKHNKFLCHQCGHQVIAPPSCSHCQAIDSFLSCGPGVERLAEEVEHLFPDSKISVISSDLIDNNKEMTKVLSEIYDRKVDIIIGTQMIAKGYHFPHLTLVGVIDADLGLGGGDVRASEKTYQLLQQVSGRAGRDQKPGCVYFQSYDPHHPVLTSLISANRDTFLEQEMMLRQRGLMPPFGRLAALILSSHDIHGVESTARRLIRKAPSHPDIYILGPAPAPLALIRGKYRWRILLQSSRQVSLQNFINQWLSSFKIPSTIRLKIDIDPYSFL